MPKSSPSVLRDARGELDRLRVTAAAEHDSRQAAARAETATGRAETARAEATEARLALVAAQGEAAAARLQERAEEELRQARTEHDIQRERAATAEQRARAAEAELERATAQAQELRDRLATAQAAAGLVLPALTDLSPALGAGVRGVTLPEAGIEAVTRRPDGTVALHHQGHEIRLSGPQHTPAHGRALAAAILAASSERP
uniref:hypothetical protein n=1 Tax=Nonomuraea sp. CA-252377 TaxID=3240003 RepID=UPI003F4947DD